MDMNLTWEILNIVGTIAFAVSGALVAIEEDFDLLGVYVLGFATAFGGGLIRNLIIDLPAATIWKQNSLFLLAFIIITLIFVFPRIWKGAFKKAIVLFDAIGLAAFAIQGANYAVVSENRVVAVMIAAALTGTGGGMLRDVLAGRKPMILHSEIYALWAALAGLVYYYLQPTSPAVIYTLILLTVILRMCSVIFNWNLPKARVARKESAANDGNESQ